MEVILLVLVGLCLVLCVGIAIAQIRIWVEYRAFQQSTHQVTYINPLTGVAARRDQPVAQQELDLSEIPNLTEEEKQDLRDRFNAGMDPDNIL